MAILEDFRLHAKKFATAIFSIGVGISAAAGFTFIDDTPDLNDCLELLGHQKDQTSSIDSQIDESTQRLETMASSTDSGVDYTRLGC